MIYSVFQKVIKMDTLISLNLNIIHYIYLFSEKTR